MSLTLATNATASSCTAEGRICGVVLEHRAAAGGIDDDRVDAGRLERREIAPGQLERRPLDSRVVIDRAATRLSARDHDLAAVFLKDARRRRVGIGKHRVGHAAQEQGDACPLRSDRRQNLGQVDRASALSLGSIACIRLRVGGKRRNRPDSFGPVKETDPLQQPGRRQRQLDPGRNTETGDGESAAAASWSSGFPSPRSASAILKGSIILPYWTPEGQADSHARQSRQSSRCSRTPGPIASRPSAIARIK